jgi:capsular exopolysaccharide synthesis family protein
MTPSSRLVALSESQSFGAEKFRALATRLENLRRKKEMKSLQITSAVNNEGKTLVAANLAATFARHNRAKTLLFEGDLHRPSLAGLLGMDGLRGLTHWWSEDVPDISHFLKQVNEMPLWIILAGDVHEQPSHILQSTRFAEAFSRLADWFDWIVVDSTPMLPAADANLWSRLVDGTLLVVRERVASVRALQKGLESLDNLKLIGTVLNEASVSEGTGYADQHYAIVPNSNRKLKE